jgi:hypothetical protein
LAGAMCAGGALVLRQLVRSFRLKASGAISHAAD